MFRIIVPFHTITAMNVENRAVILRLCAVPEVFIGRLGRRAGVVTEVNPYNPLIKEEVFWEDINSCLIHKIFLRNRQASKLENYLWAFDRRFRFLSNISVYENETRSSDEHTSSFEDELELTDLTKFFNKTRKTTIRRLPLWDAKKNNDQSNPKESEDVRKPAQVCSCRTSCRSVRCSCVKAAKSCSAGRSLCLCTNCNNPLSVLKDFNVNVNFAIQDCCLFQNVYQIQNLMDYLRREVKLSCCNTIARVHDCIPGTVLCPNADCNVKLQYSWCRGVVCYPERNPRNHCSFCGRCCFSNAKHCKICNKCYITTPKFPNCSACASKDDETTNSPSEAEPSDFVIRMDCEIESAKAHDDESDFLGSENFISQCDVVSEDAVQSAAHPHIPIVFFKQTNG